MARSSMSWRGRVPLLTGDLFIYFAATAAGFATHGELVAQAWGRFLITWLSFTTSWILLALVLQLYNPEQVRNRHRLWRPFLAAVYSAPLGAWLRSL
ncbi:MAG: DUF3054 family protein [Chloroflexota bacterium]